jgi:hypothetical protein
MKGEKMDRYNHESKNFCNNEVWLIEVGLSWGVSQCPAVENLKKALAGFAQTTVSK